MNYLIGFGMLEAFCLLLAVSLILRNVFAFQDDPGPDDDLDAVVFAGVMRNLEAR